jgi:ferredoxin-NADP reductase
VARPPRRPARRRAPDRRRRLPGVALDSIASAPEHDAVELTIERFEDGEVSPYLVDEVIAGDQFEVRGPIGGPFTWSVDEGGPLYLIGGGSGMVPLMAMLRHRAAHPDAHITAHVIVSNRSATAAFYTTELETLTPPSDSTSRGPTRAGRPTAGAAGPAAWTTRCCALPARPTMPRKPAGRVFVCGPTPFVGTVTRLLVDQGYDPRAIRAEDFGTPG